MTYLFILILSLQTVLAFFFFIFALHSLIKIYNKIFNSDDTSLWVY